MEQRGDRLERARKSCDSPKQNPGGKVVEPQRFGHEDLAIPVPHEELVHSMSSSLILLTGKGVSSQTNRNTASSMRADLWLCEDRSILGIPL